MDAPEGGCEVFISHSNADKTWADAACAVLERHRIRCWIAPRDILAGTEWGASIVAGIESCRIMVLIFSARANESPQVRREVERAISKGLTILPLRVEDVRPAGSMEYALSNTHWLDAFTPPVERQMTLMAETVGTLLGLSPVVTPAVPPAETARRRSRLARLAAAFAAVSFATCIAAGTIFFIGDCGNRDTRRESAPVTAPDPSPVGRVEPREKAAPEDDRDVALWMLSKGWSFRIRQNGEQLIVSDEQSLPPGEIRIVEGDSLYTRLTDEALLRFSKLRHLERLAFDVGFISERGMAQLKGMTALKDLYLIGVTQIADVEHLKELTNLEKLTLRGRRLTEPMLKHLRELRCLRTLDFEKWEVGESGLEALESLTGLGSLVLMGGSIDDSTLKHLRGMDKLESLDLKGSRVTDVGLEHLRDLPLTNLRLTDTGVTEKGVAAFEKLKPGCKTDASTKK